ncbi:MAG: amidohydrolase family protein [Acidobacteriota bacterium]|nr:amidohydrolase family protein [Acidobacteriota bacterium]
MKHIARILLVTLFCASCAIARPKIKTAAKHRPAQRTDTRKTLLIRDVSVVNIETGSVEHHGSVAIRGDRIAAVGPSSKIRIPANVKIIPGGGKYVIPGLWDMHVHLWYKDNQFPLFLANGITGVRDMGSRMKQIEAWRAQIKSGQLIGPRIIACGSPLNGPAPGLDSKMPVIEIRNPGDARRAFDTLDDRMKVDFVKVLSGVPKSAYLALAEVSRHWGVPIEGHLPDSVTALEAANARQTTMEHLFGIMLACSSREDELRAQRAAAWLKADLDEISRVNTEILETYDPRKAAILFERFKLYDVRQTPTLMMRKRMASIATEELAGNPNLRYVDQSIRKSWPDPSREERTRTADQQLVVRKDYQRLFALVRDMDRAGVPLLAGTDTGDPYTVPGFELHDELELLVRAGLTPLRALQTATLEPAKLLREEQSMGAVRAQYTADLVLLDANPLSDIRNTRKVAAVVVNGQYLSKSDLAGMLQSAAARALKQ